MKTRILIVDNESRWIEFAQNDLQTTFEVVVAATTREAASQLEDDNFDLVIVNARNTEVLELLSKRFSEKRMVVTTVQPSVEEAIQAYRFGAADYFPKSFRPKYLLDQVSEVLPG